MMKQSRIVAWVVPAVLIVANALGQNCDNTSTGLIPITELGETLYLDQFPGGLYPDGVNTPPDDHAAEGLARAAGIQPLNGAGQPDPDGRYVLVSIGMSNTSQEFCCGSHTFIGQALSHPDVNQTEMVIVNGAQGGKPARDWVDPDQPTYGVVAQRLAQAGVTENQVVAIWLKQANPGPRVSLPDSNADAYALLESLGDIVRAAKARYPNLQMVFLSSRIYAGYATTGLNPEPYAYESGFANKWLIEAQVNQMRGDDPDPRAGDLDYDSVAPWIGWGAYLWADGLVPREDGLIWECRDFRDDGTHPSTSGQEKVGTLLLDFFLGSPFSEPWFVDEGGGGDPEIATIEDITVTAGQRVSGGVAEIITSDDSYFVSEAWVTGEASRPHLLRLVIDATSDVENPRTLHLSFEGRISDIEAAVGVALRDWQSNQIVVIANITMGLAEEVHEFTVQGADRFVRESDGAVEVTIRKIVHFPFTLGGFHSMLDLVEIGIE